MRKFLIHVAVSCGFFIDDVLNRVEDCMNIVRGLGDRKPSKGKPK